MPKKPEGPPPGMSKRDWFDLHVKTLSKLATEAAYNGSKDLPDPDKQGEKG